MPRPYTSPKFKIACTEGDAVEFTNYGELGMTVCLTYSGESFDVGFEPEEIPALIQWLQSTQQKRS